MPSLKILQLPHQIKKDGTCMIVFRVIQDRKTRYIKSGYSVKPSQFKEDKGVVHHPDSVLLNIALERKRSEIMAGVILGSDVKKGLTFSEAIMAKMELHDQRKQLAAYNKLKGTKLLLLDAWGKDVLLNSLNKDHVDKLVAYLIGRGSKISTVKKYLSILGSLLNATESYVGKNLFIKQTKELRPEAPNREKLTVEEIKEMEKAKLYGLADVARDMFLFSFYTHGMRFENVALFEVKSISHGVLKYRMNKGKKIREIEVHEKLQAIIDKYQGKHLYLFPLIKEKPRDMYHKKSMLDSTNTRINSNLKRVAVICGIEKNLTMHIARHTFAFLSLKRGVTRNVLKDALGHSKYATTEMYLESLSDDHINDAVKGLYD